MKTSRYPLCVAFLALSLTTLPDGAFAQPTQRLSGGTTTATTASTRLTNLSVRARAGTGNETFAIGFTLTDTPDKPTLLRVIGPSLAAFGVNDALADPALILSAGGVVQRANDNWTIDIANGQSLVNEHTDAFNVVGAFPLAPTSKDAAFIKSLTAGTYTAQVGNVTLPGTVLFELYDIFPDSGARLINLSARAQVTPGTGALIAGFVVTGSSSIRVLLRGIGPGLTSLGVTGVLPNPRLELFRGASSLQSNDDWAGLGPLSDAFTAAGAFALANPASRDAAMIVTLAPGFYTAVVSGTGNEAGIALVEVYELP